MNKNRNFGTSKPPTKTLQKVLSFGRFCTEKNPWRKVMSDAKSHKPAGNSKVCGETFDRAKGSAKEVVFLGSPTQKR